MFALAILIGIYSYLIFAVGLLGILYKQVVILLTVVYLASIIFYASRFPPRRSPFGHLRGVLKETLENFHLLMKSSRLRSNNIFTFVFLLIFFLQALINLIGALGPELGFDALWYHLTLPKLYLEHHSIFYIPGGLLYYSLMPKLTEMLYVGVLALNGEIFAKLIHFSFGILSSIALYKLSRIFFSPKISLVAVVVFYSNLVVAWQSTTAYVDLARTFFEIMALWGLVNFWRKGEKKWLIESAVMLGLAVSTKLLALGSLFIFLVFIAIHSFLFAKGPPRRSPSPLRYGFAGRVVHLRGVKNMMIFLCVSILIPLPWFVFSYINTGNPVYPLFTGIYRIDVNLELLNPFRFIREVWTLFMGSSDPISPIYVIFLPLIVIFFKKFTSDIKLLAIYSFLAIIVWYVTPRTGGGRFILPYLPLFSVLVAAVIEKLGPPRRSPSGHLRGVTKGCARWCVPRGLLGGDLRSVLISVIIIISIISILYRGATNTKYIPVLLGIQAKQEFLSKNLNFSFGDFYDIDGYFKKNIRPKDTILLYGFHNLYYVDFPFIDASWVKKGDSFNYIATQNTSLPKRFKDWDLVYQNSQTLVKLYSKGGIKWVY